MYRVYYVCKRDIPTVTYILMTSRVIISWYHCFELSLVFKQVYM